MATTIQMQQWDEWEEKDKVNERDIQAWLCGLVLEKADIDTLTDYKNLCKHFTADTATRIIDGASFFHRVPFTQELADYLGEYTRSCPY